MKTRAQIFLLFLFSLLSISLYAQNNDNEADEKTVKAMDKISAAFKLEKDKKEAVKDIFTEFYTSQQKLKSDIQRPASGLSQGFASQNFQSIRKQNEMLMNNRDAKLRKEFTEEQYKKWKNEIEPTLRTRRQRD